MNSAAASPFNCECVMRAHRSSLLGKSLASLASLARALAIATVTMTIASAPVRAAPVARSLEVIFVPDDAALPPAAIVIENNVRHRALWWFAAETAGTLADDAGGTSKLVDAQAPAGASILFKDGALS